MVDRCVCCGRVIPEGRMVCPICENSEGILMRDDSFEPVSEEDQEYWDEQDDYY